MAETELTSRVLRRAQVSKMTRALQDSLKLANAKVRHGWENQPLEALQPRLTQELGRKRIASSMDALSDSSSSISGDSSLAIGGLASSPLTIPMFSDDFDRPGSGYSSNKRQRTTTGNKMPVSASSSRTGRKSRNAALVQSWKKTHQLPQSSPLFDTRHAHFRGSTNVSKLSFISEGSTIPEDAPSPELSEDDDADLPVSSFNLQPTQTAIIQSSPPPPRTPPSQRRMINNEALVSWSRTPKTGEEGADLLMFLATTPTPANKSIKGRLQPPLTPPSKNTPLPSSMMVTPGGSGLFEQFCNVTPSPAQGHFQPRTPAIARTPLAVSSARRRLNFDMVPPGTGLGMELGGEL